MKTLLSNLAKMMGYRIIKNSTLIQQSTQNVTVVENKADLLTTFYSNLKTAGFIPSFVVDIGANTGTWTRELLKNFPNSKVLMIEPQQRLQSHFQDLLNENISYLPVGVGNKNDVLKFTIHDRDDSCSFIYSEEEAKELGYEQVSIPIKTLNTIIKENNCPTPDLIKIDAEDLDLEVIEGASDFYGKTEVFLVEATVCCETYKNSVTKVIALMDQCGYQLYEITDLNRPFSETPVLWLIELAFVRKNGTLVNNLKTRL